ncbi:hypothetical protein RRG08_036876 [Elysia crispata]|uniref:Uncharacterized protein n=1 Tax=Elysia crispata TaxID=231223 RepID=A0AAE1AZJ1_9GAST|nr:hypothetical protein RRG08_036876 [Elysia crispata]
MHDVAYFCTCGELKRCPSACYCDGTQEDASTTDEARVVDKTQLPLVSIEFRQSQEDKGRVDVEPLMCSSVPIDIPKDCHEAKFELGIEEDTPLFIDLDGPGGEDPFLVFCDMESYEHVGITQIPINNGNPVDVTTQEGEPISYTQDHDKIKALIEGSLFCSQRVEFQCTNSKIGGADGAAVYVKGDMRKLDYFPGAEGKTDSCACGATESCDSDEVMCNCNIEDGQAHKDFGLIIDKSDLPVTKVTAQVGNARSSTYEIGELQCSQKQFGIGPNCENYHATGERESYSYLIDADGTGGQDPFLVECLFVEEPSQGKTIVHHDKEGNMTVDSTDVTFTYLMAKPGQIEALLKRSTFCTQEISIDCKQTTITVDPGTILWTGSGSGPSGSLKLSDYLDSCGPNGDSCKCSAGPGQGRDFGTITDMGVLPMNNIDFSALQADFNAGGSVKVNVGPLVCSEVFPTCKQLYDFVNSDQALEGEATVVNGQFTTDPDGAGGVDPFTVECTFPETVIEVDGNGEIGPDKNSPLEPVSKCFDISYTSGSGKPLSPAQVAAYAAASSSCSQSLSLKCKKAPATKMVNFTTCDGKTQVGWAGSYGRDSCACGVNGNCHGGRDALCNCDSAGNKEKEDAGVITQADRLPVCQVCLSIDPPANGKPWPRPLPQLSFFLGELVCDRPSNGIGSCQQARRSSKVRSLVEEDMKALEGPSGELVPVGCKLHRDPPLGILTVKPRDPVVPPTDDEPVDITIRYITINITLVGTILSQQEFCSQKIYLYCAQEDTGDLSGNYGWYGRDGSIHHDWTRLPDDGEDVESNCENNAKLCNLCGNPQGYLIKQKDLLPVTRLVLAGSNIGVVIENTECFDLLSSCQEIYDKDQRQTGYFGKNRYIIDVDKAGPLRPFRVLCEFDKTTDNAVTVVEVGGEWESSVPIVGQDEETEDFQLEVEYSHAIPDQINGLAKISGFCWQGVQFKCQHFPLLEDPNQPSTYYMLYDGQPASSFGTDQDVNFQGCACHKLGVCYTAMSCNCDAEGPMSVDQGAITNKTSLPITAVHVAGRNDSESVAQFQIGSVRCSARSTALPKDCAEALELVSKDGIDYRESGEYLISPKPDEVEPFMVRCDFTTFPGKGVTVFRPHFPENNPLPTNSSDTPTDVPYNGADKDQIEALVAQSAYCYQGVRFDCYHTALLSGGSYFQSTDLVEKWRFWGGGEPGENGKAGTCACGDDDACAGLDSSEGQRTRPCNCDLMDAEFRKDAGVIDNKAALPISLFQLGAVSNMSQASLTIGDLYCSQEPLNLDECALGFHDCHELATCHDMENGYHCVCPEGWQGKGAVTDSSQALANGRECIDDDECEALNPCAYTAICHNLPGSFNCTCKEGFKPISQTDCEDVDECADQTDDCGENAFCENLVGSYRCICNKGFRGDGRECIPVGQCSCFGDPHCKSFDDRWLHYQGDCHNVMATDGCDGNDPTFVVEVEMWRKDQDPKDFKYSWVKSVKVLVEGKVIKLEQGPRLVVDGQVVSQYIDSFRLRVVQVNKRIELKTFSGLEVTWDGADRVSVTVPSEARSKTCGLCGNYDGDPDNDWTVGPACPETAGQQTDNYDLFGRSWVVAGVCPANCNNTEPPPPPEDCQSASKAAVEQACTALLDKQTSVFKDCLKTRDPDALKDLKFSCVFDLCASTEELDVKICRMAETIATECAEVDKIPVKNWRQSVESCPDVSCPADQQYSDCGPSNPPTCVTGDDVVSTTVCVEGCFCPDGLLTENDKCITQEQCGCYHENNYIPTGERVILSDCSAEIVCEGKNQTSSSPVECGVHEECRTEDGAAGCYCEEGYIEVNGTCEDETCVGVVCAENMECKDGTCVCIDGFVGECGECVDIDECKTHEHTCTGRGQKCVNVPGTYRCDCEAGWAPHGKICKDVNECEVLDDVCTDHSECVNTPGGYVCECCAGYKHSGSGRCIRDELKEKASGNRCCSCKGMRCTKPGKVCGSDGNTYNSYRELSIHACMIEDDTLVPNYDGECQDSCDEVVCNRHYQQCKKQGRVARCNCPNCGNSPAHARPVCGSDGVTYPGVCSLKKAACENDYQDFVTVESHGPCPGDGQTPVGVWSGWSACSEDCKQGFRTRTRRVYVQGAHSFDTETISCYSTCDAGPCYKGSCTGVAQVCIAHDNNTVTCICPMCQGHELAPVCGRVGKVVQTFDSECDLLHDVCQQQEPDFQLLERRACEEKPTKCAAIRKFIDFQDEWGCTAERSVSVGQCYGGCDNEAKDCCTATDFRSIKVKVDCKDGSSYDKELFEVTECDCVEKKE